MSQRRIVVITVGVMLSLLLTSLEATVVATGMPTIVGQLGGLHRYSWVFSAYMLTSTLTIPLYGKLSDLYGRKPVYAIAMALFLTGSLLCGWSQSMTHLIAFRALQGLGAGGVLPLAFIIMGDLFTLEQRAHIQGLLAGLWGATSVVGPLLGGVLVDQLAWSWIFHINLVPGVLAAGLVWHAWVERPADQGAARPSVDYAGAVLLAAGVSGLLLGVTGLGTRLGWALLAGAAVSFAGLAWVERRVADPVLPVALFRDRLFAVACLHGVLTGWAMFGSMAYVPLFVQAVLRTSATAAGATLTPLLLAWVLASIVGSRLLLKRGYRPLALSGMVLLTGGALIMSRSGTGSAQVRLGVGLALMGAGMGLSIPAFLIAVQNTVARRFLGTATSTLQFSRSIGGVLGVSVMGGVLSISLAANLHAAGVNPAALTLNTLLAPVTQASVQTSLDPTVRTALADAMHSVFLLAVGAAALGLAATALAPSGRLAHRAAQPAHPVEDPANQPAPSIE